MSVWSVDGERPTQDVRNDRIAAGTVGGEHGVPGSFGSGQITQIIKPFSPFLHYYGGPSGSTWAITDHDNNLFMFNSFIRNNAVGAQLALNFSGTSIAFYGSIGPNRGQVKVYVDGNLAAGRTNAYTVLVANLAGSGYEAPQTDNTAIAQLSATTTTIPCGTIGSEFPASGTILIDSEQITYTSNDGSNFLGCTRGANGTTADVHNAGSTVYYFSSTVEMYASNYSYRQLLYSNPFLTPGDHQIVIEISGKNASATDYAFVLEALLVGGILGTGSISTQVQTLDVLSIATDANGIAEFGLAGVTLDYQLIGILGVYDAGFTVTSWQWNPTTGYMRIKGTANHTYAAGDIKVTIVCLGAVI